MRLSFLLLALVAAATAIPKLKHQAGNVEVLKKQRDAIIFLREVYQDLRDEELLNIGREYDILQNLEKYHDKAVVKYLFHNVKLGYFQKKGAPFTASISKLRKEVAVLTRTFIAAKDYDTFRKTVAWARCVFNEAQFVKAYVAAILQRPDTRDYVVLPPLYEVMPYYYFDSRTIKEAQKIRSCGTGGFEGDKSVVIPSNYTSWLPEGEHSLTYFTQDIGLAAYYAYFNFAGWMLSEDEQLAGDTVTENYDSRNCEISRGSQYYYIHQQLLARYYMERLSNNLGPLKDMEGLHIHVPYKPHLSYPNGLEFPGRDFDLNLMPEKERLVRTVQRLERRLKDVIDSGFVLSPKGSILALYDRKGMDMLGNLIEGTGRSINPRYYGSLQAAARELLGGSTYSKYFWEPTPSALEIPHTATRDPMFYRLYKRIILMFKDYQESLPSYKQEDLIVPEVKIESVNFSKLMTYREKYQVNIDAATDLPCEHKDKQHFEIKAEVDRLNHEPFDYEIVVQSVKPMKDAVVRVYIGPKYDFYGQYVHIRENRMHFVEIDQFKWTLNEGKTVITRNSREAPMRSFDFFSKKDIYHKVEQALNSHEPFYPITAPQTFGFPERLALPKGKYHGMPLQVFVIISSSKPKTFNYEPVVSPQFQTYQKVNFQDLEYDYSMYKTHRDTETQREDYVREDTTHEYTGPQEGERFRTQNYLSALFGGRTDSMNRYGAPDFEYHETQTQEHFRDPNTEGTYDYWTEYYKDKKIYEIIGGAVSLDKKPLGYPFDRRLAPGSLDIPNAKVIDVKVYYKGRNY